MKASLLELNLPLNVIGVLAGCETCLMAMPIARVIFSPTDERFNRRSVKYRC
ncbi:MAG: hypothetical protein ACLR5N_03315 [Haemophilus parainfluenzae]